MKGIVFTELMEMVAQVFGEDMWDDILDDCDLESKGAYTAVGTYNHMEMLQIVGALSKKTDMPIRDLIYKYGHYLFARFFTMMPQFFEKPQDTFSFLSTVHDTIHVEVKKLYPDAQLPHFSTCYEDDGSFTMIYQSICPFADFAAGLIAGCIDYYGEDIVVTYEDHNALGQYRRVFLLVKRG